MLTEVLFFLCFPAFGSIAQKLENTIVQSAEIRGGVLTFYLYCAIMDTEEEKGKKKRGF